MARPDGPLVVQSDLTLLLDVHNALADECRDSINAFTELIKSPEHLHTFRITQLSIWNARSTGMDEDGICATLDSYSRFPIPSAVEYFIRDNCRRYGAVRFQALDDGHFRLSCQDAYHRRLLESQAQVKGYLGHPDGDGFIVGMMDRGPLKTALVKAGLGVEDLVPLSDGQHLDIKLRNTTRSGRPFMVRPYQEAAFKAFWAEGRPGGGHGTVVMPCGSGKTIVGILAMARLAVTTLILTPNVASAHQWIREILDKTGLDEDLIGEYGAGDAKQVRPVTVCTYSMLTWRPDKEAEFGHFKALASQDWGLVIYDEVHLLPAPVFRFSSAIQSRRRLGLTATLVREDGREDEVFSLVGPKRFDIPWSELEKQGWIATAWCHELRIQMDESLRLDYATASGMAKARIAAMNPAKKAVVRALLEKHEGEHILIIGQYIEQLEELAKDFGFPLITGRMANKKREDLYEAFRKGDEKVLIVSKVANFAIDLPDASVLIQVSGGFGSRQEEAQRLGRILRPKERDSNFYTLVSKYSKEEDFSLNRQKFLSAQGYQYSVEDWQ